ncbi:DUF2953 domain-containing protein [Aneurinibacillus terranovensis]|uniref:DUF2953 domain-containing protein n=1 Tax=Aneurinibacillus terranovensis TaxID=278991 RepID=UPI0004153E83|nr:DUF2953 domain-containing protein [Aneurinibacillus terranovensis]
MNGWTITFIIILCMLIILLIILWTTSIRIQIVYKRENENDRFEVEISIWRGLLRYHLNIPLLDLQSLTKGVTMSHRAKSADGDNISRKRKERITPHTVYRLRERFLGLLDNIHDFSEILKRTLKTIRCERLEWTTRVGIREASATGTLTGLVWGVKSGIIAVIAHYISMYAIPRLQVIPDFNNEQFNTQFLCIVKFRLGNAIIAGIRLLLNLRKGRESYGSSD